MIVQFNNDYLEALYEGKPVLGKPKFSGEVVLQYKKTILKLQFASNIAELKKIRGLNFEALKGDMKGLYSVRVNLQYRLILSIDKRGVLSIGDVLIVEDLSKHYE